MLNALVQLKEVVPTYRCQYYATQGYVLAKAYSTNVYETHAHYDIADEWPKVQEH